MKKLNVQLDSIKEMLTKEQMKKVVGGYHPGTCSITPSSGNPYTIYNYENNSTAGNNACLGWIALHGGRCSYGCSYDGVG